MIEDRHRTATSVVTARNYVVAYNGKRIEEIIAAEQGDPTDSEKALLELLKTKLRREIDKVRAAV